ncbi:MAG: hypothetical protein HOP12_04260 [Candidatus Eisenbacteria bacterium]|uniref:Glycosyltransferase RgtA/B/C/D-like domain-containing protein n=1 Tax=Eiseniibacteriota bacterium TaxID=2212470 RepID=A0A849SKJ9_UNCEI|nr:hypothetical protein [Candidatus Eisenbacteria bacterium]
MTPRDRPKRASSWWLPLLVIGAVAAVGYALLLAHVQTWETLAQAARAVDDPLVSERYFSTRLLHPNHLLFMPAARAWHRLAAQFGARDPFATLGVLSAIAGGALVTLSGALARALGGSRRRAVWVAVAVAVANVVSRLATEIGAIVPATALLLTAARLMLRARDARAWGIAGLTLAAAVLIHQMSVVFVVAAVLALGWQALRGRFTTASLASFVIAAVVPVLSGYWIAGRIAAPPGGPAEILAWVLTVRDRSDFVAGTGSVGFARAGIALVEAWVTLIPLHALRAGRGLEPGVLAGVAATAFAAGTAAALGLRALGSSAAHLARRRSMSAHGIDTEARVDSRTPAGRLAVTCGALALAAFALWYQPGNHVFWVFAPPFALAFLAVGLPSPPARWRVAARAVGVAAIVAAASSNLAYRALPARDVAHAPYADLLEFARTHFEAGDALVSDPLRSVLREGLMALPVLARVRLLTIPDSEAVPTRADFERQLDALLAEAGRGRHALYALPEARAAVQSRGVLTGSDLVARPVGVLRADTVWRFEPNSR